MAQTLKNALATLTPQTTTIYTCPPATQAVVFGAQAANVCVKSRAVTMGSTDDSDGDAATAWLGGVVVSSNTTTSATAAHVVLESGDSVYGSAIGAPDMQLNGMAVSITIRKVIVRGTRRIVFGNTATDAVIYTSDALGPWILRHSSATKFPAHPNAYTTPLLVADNGTTIVAVRGSGKICTSSDAGTTWTERTGVGTDALYCVKFFGSTVLIAGANGRILRSTDSGATWSSVLSAGGSVSFTDIANVGSTLVAAGGDTTNLRAYSSTDDGASWTSRTVGAGNGYCSRLLANSTTFLFINTGSGNGYSSTDGATWTSRAALAPTASYYSPCGVVLGEAFYLFGYDAAGVSVTSNGATLNTIPFGFSRNLPASDVVVSGNTIAVVGLNDVTVSYVANMSAWYQTTYTSYAGTAGSCVIDGDGLLVTTTDRASADIVMQELPVSVTTTLAILEVTP